ncbi:MAG: formyltetrahydrofolate deformylase, partial [Rhodocyclaceae bacterium]|nr:formyltetrahydrofolate deformylase [Rhodocyclaceae bacterium]
MHRERFYTLSASCPDQVGIVARVSGFIAEHQGWILETALHAEPPREGETVGRYFMRIEIRADSLPFMLSEFRERFQPLADALAMDWKITDSAV